MINIKRRILLRLYQYIFSYANLYIHRIIILAPNGINASFASLKHCFPNGMPIIVIHRRNPFNTATHASGKPPKISHRIFKIRDTPPPPYTTSLPNGKNESCASLKH
jgi:hypothetical protein